MQDYIDDLEDLENSFRFADKSGTLTMDEANRAANILIDAETRADAEAAALGTTATASDKTFAQHLFMLQNANSGLFTAEEEIEAVKYLKDHVGDSATTTALMDSMTDDFDTVSHVLAKKISSLTDAETDASVRAEADIVVDGYETGDMRAGLAATDFSIHEIIAKKENAADVDAMFDDVFDERRRVNQAQVTYTKDWAQDLLARDGVDIKEGGLDRSTRFMHAQTLDDINDDGVKALRNAVRRTAPFFHPNETTGGISEKYAEETKKKNAHFYGDKR